MNKILVMNIKINFDIKVRKKNPTLYALQTVSLQLIHVGHVFIYYISQ